MRSRTLACALALLAWSSPAYAQLSFESIGARALGMGGAFVAVANDASAFHWNPAGLANGGLYSMTVGWDKLHFGNPKLPAVVGATEEANTLTGVGTLPFGVSYGYFKASRVVAVLIDGTPVVQTLRVHHLGATVVHTLMKGVTVGATLKYLRGQATIGETNGFLTGEALDEALERTGHSDGAFDLDFGVQGEMGPVRAGLTIKNVTEPTFVGDAGFAIQLQRRTRLGLALLPTHGLTLAFDIDLDTADPLVGLRRMMALGGEVRLGNRMALRSGVRWSRDGERRPIGALGLSLLLRQGLWLDGYTIYSRFEDRGFGIAMRAGS